ncbi:MAG: ribosome biogenesis GTPase Der [Candidatus Magasanikbacteria bacterium]
MSTSVQKYEGKMPTVAIVGRTNVGKSTLFNRLIEKEEAIVSEKKGTTRTSNTEIVQWRGEKFKLIDTGGLEFDPDLPMEDKIEKQVNAALDKAEVIIFLTDGQEAILKQEKEIAQKLQRKEKDVILTMNKIDNESDSKSASLEEWYRLGLGEPIEVSALNGRNIGQLLDKIHEILKDKEEFQDEELEKEKKVSIIGRPNAGKSTLFNNLIGEDEVIVSKKAHTTREPHRTKVIYSHKVGKETKKEKINFIDTAGIRKKKNVEPGIEQQGVNKSIEAIEKSNIVLFVIDGSRKISKQDKKLGSLLKNKLKSVIILINKWDLTEDNQEKRNYVKKRFFQDFPHLDFAPLLFVSALTGKNVHKIFPKIIKAWEARNIHIPEEGLKSFLKTAAKKHKPRKGKGTKEPKLLKMKQVSTDPLVFELYINEGAYLADNYVNYLKNKMRERFGFFATPIRIKLKK